MICISEAAAFFLFVQYSCFADKSGFSFVQIKYQEVNLVRIMIP